MMYMIVGEGLASAAASSNDRSTILPLSTAWCHPPPFSLSLCDVAGFFWVLTAAQIGYTHAPPPKPPPPPPRVLTTSSAKMPLVLFSYRLASQSSNDTPPPPLQSTATPLTPSSPCHCAGFLWILRVSVAAGVHYTLVPPMNQLCPLHAHHFVCQDAVDPLLV